MRCVVRVVLDESVFGSACIEEFVGEVRLSEGRDWMRWEPLTLTARSDCIGASLLQGGCCTSE